jgi:putative heme-binding domain-containing protein
MNGRMVVARDEIEAEALEAACRPAIVRAWRGEDFAAEDFSAARDAAAITRGMHAFAKAQCTQCHAAAGHAAAGTAAGTPALGPDLVETLRRHRGRSLLEQILEPSREIHERYRTEQFLLTNGRLVAGIVREETPDVCRVVPNLLAPETVVTVRKADVEERVATRQSAMPAGLLDVLSRQEILDLVAFVEAGADLPPGVRHEPKQAPAAAALP